MLIDLNGMELEVGRRRVGRVFVYEWMEVLASDLL